MTDTTLGMLDEATRPRRLTSTLPLALAAVALALVLLTVGSLIVHTQRSSRARIVAGFAARGATSAGFVSALINTEATRQELTASSLLTGRVPPAQLTLVARAFGTPYAAVVDDDARVIAVTPVGATPVGSSVLGRLPFVLDADTGQVAVSGNLRAALPGPPAVAIAVPYAAPTGRRVFAVVMPIARGTIAEFMRHTVMQPNHSVYLIDGEGSVLASDASTTGRTLAAASPALAAQAGSKESGTVTIDHRPNTFTTTAVAGTNWRLVVAVPSAELFATIGGANQWLPWLAFAIVAALGAALWGFFASFLADRRRLTRLSAEVLELARTDALTGLPNRLALSDSLSRALAGAERYELPLSLLMIDLDNFKDINDAHGHDVGDRVLRAVAACLREVLRVSDLYGRWGGDEFLAVLTQTPPEGAELAARRLRDQAAALDLSRFGVRGGISMSIGCTPAEGDMSELLHRVDTAMYTAKRRGRGGVFLAAPPTGDDIAA